MSEQKLVPVESTSAMDIAGAEVMHGDFNRNDAERVWRAMVSAAPIPEQVAPVAYLTSDGRALHFAESMRLLGQHPGDMTPLYAAPIAQEVTQQAAADETTQDMLVGATYALRAIAEGTGSPASTARAALRVIASLSTEGTQQAAKAETAEHAEAEDQMPSPLYYKALALVHERGKASVSLVQRIFAISYSDAENLIELMVLRGDVSHSMTSGLRIKPRQDIAPTTSTVSASSAPECGMCGDSGIVGFPPDQYESCPDCTPTAAQAATDKSED